MTAFTFGFIGLQQVLTGSLRGSGDTVAPMVLAIISLWVLQFPLAYVLSKHTGLGRHGIWWSFAVSNVLAASVTFAWFLRGLEEAAAPGGGRTAAADTGGDAGGGGGDGD